MSISQFSPELALSLSNSRDEFPVDFNDAWQWLEYDGFKAGKRGESYICVVTDRSIKFRYGGWHPGIDGFLKISDEGLLLFVSMCEPDLHSDVGINDQQLEWHILEFDNIKELFVDIAWVFEIEDRFPSMDVLLEMPSSTLVFLMLAGRRQSQKPAKEKKVKLPTVKKVDAYVPPSQVKENKNAHIYCMRLDGCIKIGFSSNVLKRMKAFVTSNKRVELLYIAPSTLSQEKSFHSINNRGDEKYNLEDESRLIVKLIEKFGVNQLSAANFAQADAISKALKVRHLPN